jgi:C-terminal processing protease CtpA/Prc
MKLHQLLLYCFISIAIVSSCQDDQDDVIQNVEDTETPSEFEDIKDYIMDAMKIFYVYKSDAPDLADNRFENNKEYTTFLNSIESPVDFFYSLLAPQDRFSFMVEDFIALEESFQGISLSNGMAFGLVRFSDTNTVFGYVRYVVPDSPADKAGLKRGDIFNSIDNNILTPETNFGQLLAPESYTIGMAKFQEGKLVSLDQDISLTKIELTENPIHLHKVIEADGQKVGYLMYNNFRRNFDSELNGIFGEFKSEGISELVLDLRYNSGGNIETCKDLSSMITGQFEGQVFAKYLYNENIDNRTIEFDNTINTDEAINSLNLTRVFVLTTKASASASELLINALNPYINVVQIGDRTSGKFEGSLTLYDSPDYSRDKVNLEHTYAIQPLILRTANKNGFTDFVDGLVPDIDLNENFDALGTLGDPQETLLNRALQEISPSSVMAASKQKKSRPIELLGENMMNTPSYQRMYVDFESLDTNE